MTQRIFEHIDDFLERTKENNISSQTFSDRERVLRELEKYLENENISIHLSETYEAVSKIKAFFDEADISLTGAYVSALTSYFEFLSDENLQEENEIDSCIILLRKQLKPKSETVDEIQKVEKGKLSQAQKLEILDSCDTLEENLIIRILLDTGMKAGELHTLKKKDLKTGDSLNPAYFKIARHKASKGDIKPHDENSKQNPRKVALRLETLRIIQKHIDENLQEEEEFLLWGYPDYQKTRRHFNKVISKSDISKKKKEDLSLEPFRANAMVELIEKGYSRRNIKEYMGKTSLLTSEVMTKYSNPREESPLAINRNLF